MEAILQDRIYEKSIFGTHDAWGFTGTRVGKLGKGHGRDSRRGERSWITRHARPGSVVRWRGAGPRSHRSFLWKENAYGRL